MTDSKLDCQRPGPTTVSGEAELPIAHSVPRLAGHFTLLVYPFRHVLDADNRAARLRPLTARWLPWWRRLDDGDLEAALDDTHFFLPYVRSLLFPETAHLPVDYPSRQVGAARRLADLPADRLAERLHPDGVLRLTLNPAEIAALGPLELDFARTDESGRATHCFSAPFRLAWVDTALFPQHVGFLILKVELTEQPPTVPRLVGFLSHLRLVHPPKVGWDVARWRSTAGDTWLKFESRNLVDYLLQGLAAGLDQVDPTLKAYIARGYEANALWRYSATDEGQVYGQAFRQFSYACLDRAPDSDVPGSQSTVSGFASPAQQWLYEIATCTHLGSPDLEPHPDGLARLMEKGQIALWANWQGLALHDNVVFLGVHPSGFTLGVLPENVESDYFPLYLLTLYQKIRLSLLSGELMRYGASLHRNLGDARSLWDAFIMFRNHYWFPEVTFKPQGMELYRRFGQALDLLPVYESISDEVYQLQEYYERKAERHVDDLLKFLTFVGLPAGLLTQLFGGALIKETSWGQFGLVGLGVYAVVIALWVAWSRLGGPTTRATRERIRSRRRAPASE